MTALPRLSADAESARLFETAFGWCGVAATVFGLRRFFLPGSSPDRVAARLAPLRSSRGEAALLDEVCGRARRYFAGEGVTFDDLPVDMTGIDPFRLAIYEHTRALARGETVTYGELAIRAGFAGRAREVGQAMGSNPLPLIVPCHRVLPAGGGIGGFSAPGGGEAKRRMLALEGARRAAPAAQLGFGF